MTDEQSSEQQKQSQDLNDSLDSSPETNNSNDFSIKSEEWRELDIEPFLQELASNEVENQH